MKICGAFVGGMLAACALALWWDWKHPKQPVRWDWIADYEEAKTNNGRTR